MIKPSYLSSFEAPKLTEIDSLPADGELLFLDIHSVNALRSAQHSIHGESMSYITDTHGSMLTYGEISAEADRDCEGAYDEISRDFLLQFVDADAAKFDEYLDIIRSFSIDRISEEEMALGKIDSESGDRDEGTAGYKTLALIRSEKISDLESPDDETLETAHDTDAVAKKAEHGIAVGNLSGARTALAIVEVQYRSKKMFGRKQVTNERLAELQEAYRLASKAEVLAGFELIKAAKLAAGEDEPTAKELNHLAQIAFVEEFRKFAEEQNNEAYLTEYGKKARKFGEVTVGRRLKRAAVILGLGALGMSTGGIFAAGLFGTATALRIWQTKAAGTVGHSTKKGTDRITNKINKKILRDTKASLSINEDGDTVSLADTVASGHMSVSERTRKSNSIRRKLVPVLIASAAAGGIVKSFAEWNEKKDLVGNVRENLSDFDWKHPLHEWNPFNHNEDHLVGTVGDVAENTGSEGSSGALVQVGKETVTTGTPLSLQETANLASLDRLLNAQGSYPWGRAMDFYNGDAAGAKSWLETAVAKTPGAQWHNTGDGIGTNDWISINGESDTNAVWKELTKNMLGG